MTKNVVVYSKPGCGQCQFTKKHLNKLGVEFTEKNLTKNPEWVSEVTAMGFSGLPVVQIEGEEPFTGFQPDRLNRLVN